MPDDEDDDWAPLTKEQLAQSLGEADSVAFAAPAAVPARAAKHPAVVVALPQPKRVRAPNPKGEQMLRELQERLAKQGPGDSLIAQVQQREQRAARQQQAAKQSQQDLAACVLGGAAGAAPPQSGPTQQTCQVEYADVADARDDSEDSEWYQQLPEAEQLRLRLAWAQKRRLASTAHTTQKRIGNRRMISAWVSAGLVVLLGSGLFWHATLAAGVVCGFWWRHAAADRMFDPLRGIVCMVVVQGIVMAAQTAYNPGMMMDCVLVAAFGALIGYDGEIRRTGGFDAMLK